MAVKKTKDVESISIHALTKRATNGELVVDVQRLISIHALTKRATITMFPSLIKGDIISIHALTKRATGSAGRVKWGGLYFNPRSHEESDCRTSKPDISRGKFQSTLSRRERHDEPVQVVDLTHISIHALTKRATLWCMI